MKRIISDDALKVLIAKATSKAEGPDEYWQRALIFLEELHGRDTVTLKQHNWLSEIRAALRDPWE